MTENTNSSLNNLNNEIATLKTSVSSTVQQAKAEPEWWSATNAMTVSSAVLIFGVLILVLATYLIRVGNSADSVLKIFGTILIVIASIFLVVAGYSDKQIAPVMGLLGTIAGYLLGKETKKDSTEI